MKRINIWVLLISLIVVVALVFVKFTQIKTLIKMGEEFELPPVLVTHSEVQQQQWQNSIQLVGTLVADQAVIIKTELAGKVERLNFSSGDTVNKGDILLVQDSDKEQAQLKAAKANLQLANNQLRREKQLKNTRNTSQSKIEDAMVGVVQAEAQLELIKLDIDAKTIKAPFSGLLGIKTISVGQELTAGQSIIGLQQPSPLLVNFSLPQKRLQDIQIGMPIHLLDEQQHVQAKAQVSVVSPAINETTRSVEVQAVLENTEQRFRPGMFVNIEIPLPQKNTVLLVPSSAILYAPFGTSVFSIEEKDSQLIAVQKIVELGEVKGDFTQIKKGLTNGEKIVDSGVFKLLNGQTITLDNKGQYPFKAKP